MIKKLILVVLIFVLPVLVFANPYYVTNSGAGIRDGLSLLTAFSRADFSALTGTGYAGTTFYFSGSFTGRVDVRISGTSGSPVVLDGYQAGSCDWINDGACASAAVMDNQEMRLAQDVGYVNIQDFNFQGTASNTTATNSGIDTINAAPSTSGVNNIHVSRVGFYGIRQYAVAFRIALGYSSVTYSRFEDCGNAIYIINEEGSSPGLVSTNWLFANNYFLNMNNTGKYTKLDGFPYDGHAVGLQNLKATIVRDNISVNGRDDYAYWQKVNLQSLDAVVVRNNIARGGTGTNRRGIIVHTDSATVEAPNFIIYRNAVAERDEGYRTSYSRLSAVRLMHNTFYNIGAGYGNLLFRRGPANNHWYNNIFKNSATDLVAMIEHTYGTPTNMMADYNIYTDATPTWYYNTSRYSTLASWKTAINSHFTGLDANSFETDPNLVDPAAGDYSILSSSSAFDAGTVPVTITSATGSGTSFVVSDPYYFHTGFGVVDIAGTVETGSSVTLYDAVNGYQNRTVTAVNYSTGAITLNSSVSWTQNTTTIWIAYEGNAPDIGYYEASNAIYGIAPTDNATGVSTSAVLTWNNPTGTTDVDVYFEAVSGTCNLEVGDRVVDGVDVETYNPGGMLNNQEYCWRVDVNLGGTTETGTVYSFTTVPAYNPPMPSGTVEYTPSGGKFEWAKSGPSLQ